MGGSFEEGSSLIREGERQERERQEGGGTGGGEAGGGEAGGRRGRDRRQEGGESKSLEVIIQH